MPFERPTLQQLNARIMADISSKLGSTASVIRRAWVRVFAAVFAGAIHLLYGFIAWAADQIFAQTADAESLVKKAAVYGIARKAGTYASGNIRVTGTQGVLIPLGTVFKRSDGFRYQTTQAYAIGPGPTDIPARALVIGETGNLIGGIELTLESPIANVNSIATVATDVPFTLGAGLEPLEDFRARYLARVQNPPQGGAKADYIGWAKSVVGVGTVIVYGPDDISKSLDPSNPGPLPVTPPAGDVWVYFAEADGSTPSAPRIAAVDAYIRARMPLTVNLKVFGITKVTPTFVINAHPAVGFTPAQMKADILGALTDLLISEALPGSVVFLSQIDEAISKPASEAYHSLVTPNASLVFAYNEMGRIDESLVTINTY